MRTMRGLLRSIYRKAVSEEVELIEYLYGLQEIDLAAVASGKTLKKTVKSGHEVEFEVPPQGRGITQTEWIETMEYLIEVCEENAGDDDGETFANAIAAMVSITQVQSNFYSITK